MTGQNGRLYANDINILGKCWEKKQVKVTLRRMSAEREEGVEDNHRPIRERKVESSSVEYISTHIKNPGLQTKYLPYGLCKFVKY